MDTMFTGLADLFFTTDFFLYTGMAVWAVIGAVIAMFLIVRLIMGVVNALSLARWTVRSGCCAFGYHVILDAVCNVWLLRNHPIWRPGPNQYRAMNGGFWKSAFDFADSGRVIRDRLAADLARQRAAIAAAELSDTQSIPAAAL